MRMSSLRRLARPCRAFIIICTLVSIPVMVESANAYTLFGTGCRYDPSNDDDGLGIGIKTDDPLYDTGEKISTENGALGWNQVMTPQFMMVSYGSPTRDLRVEWQDLGINVGGQLSYSCGSDHYTADPLFEWGANATYYSSTSGRRIAIAEHEIGHSYGLDHNNTAGCNGNTAGVMYTDAVAKYNLCLWSIPTADDTNGAIDAHNG